MAYNTSVRFFDTHCHIHEIEGDASLEHSVTSKWHKAGITDAGSVIRSATEAGVDTMICVGTTLRDSEQAIHFVKNRPACFASIGIHPHESRPFQEVNVGRGSFSALAGCEKVVAIGECGLDYFYEHSPRADQISVLEFQLQLAQDHDLPVIFHIRDAFDDFWPIFDNFSGLTGVIHSFTAHSKQLKDALSRDLYIGLNGIMTFTKDALQLEAAKMVPLNRLVLETDAPFLTPRPYRGTMCEPKHVVDTASFLCGIRNEPLEELAVVTTKNARELFRI